MARICTKICTLEHHLALGLVTSPILADQVLRRVDVRIGFACRKIGLVYTRWVDDIVISGRFDLLESGIRSLVSQILRQNGFRTNPAKDSCGRFADGLAVTKVRIRRDRLDVQKHYYDELERQLQDARSLAEGGPFTGPFFTKAQIAGRVQFVCWINPGRRNALRRQIRSIDWRLHAAESLKRGCTAFEKQLVAVLPPSSLADPD